MGKNAKIFDDFPGLWSKKFIFCFIWFRAGNISVACRGGRAGSRRRGSGFRPARFPFRGPTCARLPPPRRDRRNNDRRGERRGYGERREGGERRDRRPFNGERRENNGERRPYNRPEGGNR